MLQTTITAITAMAFKTVWAYHGSVIYMYYTGIWYVMVWCVLIDDWRKDPTEAKQNYHTAKPNL